MGQFVIEAEGPQHIGGLQTCRSAGRAGGHSQVPQGHHQRLPFNKVETDVQVARHPLLQVAIHIHLLNVFQPVQQPLAKFCQPLLLCCHLLLGDGVGLTHAHDLVGSQSAGAHAPLMAAAVNLRLNAHPRLAPHIQGTHTLGAVNFVGGEGHEIHLHFLQVNLQFASTLGRIHMEDDPVLTGNLADGGDVVDDTDFVVHMHEGHQDSVLADGGGHGLWLDEAIGTGVQIGNLKAFPLQLAATVQHRLVFNLGGDDVLALAAVEVGGTLDGQVVGLGSTGSPDDFPRVAVEQVCHLTAGVLHCLLGLPAEAVGAGSRVAEVRLQGEALGHLLCHPGVHRGGGGVVQVDG